MTPACAVVLMCGLFETRPFEPGELETRLRTLAVSTAEEEVKKVAGELWRRTGRDEMTRVLSALDSAYARLADDGIRIRLVSAAAQLAVRHNADCPLLLCKAVAEAEEEQKSVAFIAQHYLHEHYRNRIPQSGEEYIFRTAGSPKPDVRKNGVYMLADLLPHHPRTKPILREALNDTDIEARHNAHVAMYNLTNRIEDLLPHVYRVVLEYRRLHELAESATDGEKGKRSALSFPYVGCVNRLTEWTEDRPVELRRALFAVTRHLNAEVRMNNVRRIWTLADAWISPDPNQRKVPEPSLLTEPNLAKRRKGLEILFADGQLAARLAEMAVKDPDPEVRKWAKQARDAMCEQEHRK